MGLKIKWAFGCASLGMIVGVLFFREASINSGGYVMLVPIVVGWWIGWRHAAALERGGRRSSAKSQAKKARRDAMISILANSNFGETAAPSAVKPAQSSSRQSRAEAKTRSNDQAWTQSRGGAWAQSRDDDRAAAWEQKRNEDAAYWHQQRAKDAAYGGYTKDAQYHADQAKYYGS